MKKSTRSPLGRSNTRNSVTLWWLPITFFLLSTAAQQGEALIATPNLELAMMGYDPLMTDVMDWPDQARKWRIFTAQQRDSLYVEKKEDVLNDFVDEVQHSQCSPSLTEAVVHTYEEYKSLTTAAISFVTEADATTPLGATQFNFKDKAGAGNLYNTNAVLIRDFFNQSEREVRLVKAECVTHTVSIFPFHEPVFTPAFISALHVLHESALDTESDTRKKVFSQFVRSYGTHFTRTTHFGYAAYFGILFTTQAKTPAEETVRRQCMLESANETLTPGARRGCETTAQHFSRVVVNKCEEDGVDVLVTETGSASVSGAGDCDLAVKQLPRPVAYILEKISSLFKETWIGSHTLELRQISLNGTALSAYFEDQMGENSQDVTKKAETPSNKQCSWRRSIRPKTRAVVTGPSEAEDKTSSAVNGGIIIVGGLKALGIQSTLRSIALFVLAPALFPVALHDNTLSVVGRSIYSCGGQDSSYNKKCWIIDTATPNTTWQSFDIPWALSKHSAVVVQEEIWFFLDSKLRILQTRNGANTFLEIDLGFSFSSFICAVATGSQSFVIGAGEGKDEVYVNTDYSKPEQWERFSTLRQGRSHFACLVFGGEVLVTGGWVEANRTRLSSVEAISVVDGTVKSLSPLGGTRNTHQMAIVHGRPAVLGGTNGTVTATIETYDRQTDSWEALGYSLSEPRYQFGLAQCFP